ncbi:hypothetical protein IE53DRAFT_388603 [Violaceomyces palustris]|uniref:Uncharacterized protein n=1 Tax=Violaceomyces palustris TaxID=1673888 RepID=A0ACD0NTS8_9BASI|nr:hypothetical protein IE53DRAFT_388603 [Violaceomyces palustris]
MHHKAFHEGQKEPATWQFFQQIMRAKGLDTRKWHHLRNQEYVDWDSILAQHGITDYRKTRKWYHKAEEVQPMDQVSLQAIGGDQPYQEEVGAISEERSPPRSFSRAPFPIRLPSYDPILKKTGLSSARHHLFGQETVPTTTYEEFCSIGRQFSDLFNPDIYQEEGVDDWDFTLEKLGIVNGNKLWNPAYYNLEIDPQGYPLNYIVLFPRDEKLEGQDEAFFKVSQSAQWEEESRVTSKGQILSMPNEVTRKIISILNLNDRMLLSNVSKGFAEILNEDYWKEEYETTFPDSVRGGPKCSYKEQMKKLLSNGGRCCYECGAVSRPLRIFFFNCKLLCPKCRKLGRYEVIGQSKACKYYNISPKDLHGLRYETKLNPYYPPRPPMHLYLVDDIELVSDRVQARKNELRAKSRERRHAHAKGLSLGNHIDVQEEYETSSEDREEEEEMSLDKGQNEIMLTSTESSSGEETDTEEESVESPGKKHKRVKRYHAIRDKIRALKTEAKARTDRGIGYSNLARQAQEDAGSSHAKTKIQRIMQARRKFELEELLRGEGLRIPTDGVSTLIRQYSSVCDLTVNNDV